MTQASRSTLRDLRTRLQSTIDTDIVQNTTGDITGDKMNAFLDSTSQLLVDIIDSADILDGTSLAPAIRSFVIDGQDASVDAGTTLSGTVTFDFDILEPDNVDGNLTLTQGVSTLSATIDPKGGSFTQAINSVTLNAGDSVTFTLSGTALLVAGSGAFQSQFTVTARQPDDYMYWGFDADGNPANFDTGTAQQAVFQQAQSITVPTFSGQQYFVIAQKSSDPPIRQIFIGGIDQFNAFAETVAAFAVNTANYDAYVSDHAWLGSLASGDMIQIVR